MFKHLVNLLAGRGCEHRAVFSSCFMACTLDLRANRAGTVQMDFCLPVHPKAKLWTSPPGFARGNAETRPPQPSNGLCLNHLWVHLALSIWAKSCRGRASARDHSAHLGSLLPTAGCWRLLHEPSIPHHLGLVRAWHVKGQGRPGPRRHPVMGLPQVPGPAPKRDPKCQQDVPRGLVYPEVPSCCSQHHLPARGMAGQAGTPAQHVCTPNPDVRPRPVFC